MRYVATLLSLTTLLAGCGAIPQAEAPRRQSVKQSTAVFTPHAEARVCLSQLGQTQARFSPLPDAYYGAGCSAVNAVSLQSLRSDEAALAVTNLTRVGCPLATTFAGWARFGADRAASQILGSPLARIETFGSYNCRDVAGTARRSAHASAGAIDIAAFVLADGRRIAVASAWADGTPSERRFLRVIHQSACKRFGTVLGPGYNAAHADHFHVELGGGRFCR